MERFLTSHRMSTFLTLLLRVPPIILMDFICNSKYCISLDGWLLLKSITNFIICIPISLKSNTLPTLFPLLSFDNLASLFLQIFGFLLAVILFSQETHHLLSFYLSAAALGVVLWSYILNIEFIKFCSDLLSQHSSLQQELFSLNQNALLAFFCNYVSQTFLALVFCFSTVNLPDFPHKKFLIGFLFIFPTLINAAMPSTVLSVSPILVSIMTYAILIFHFLKCFPKIFHSLLNYLLSWRFSFHFRSILTLFVRFWIEHQVTQVLQLFYVIRFVKIFIHFINDNVFCELCETKNFSYSPIKFVFKYIVIESFENIIVICGLSSVLSFVVNKVFSSLQSFLTVPKDEQSSISAMFSQLLVILCVKFGVTNLPPDLRLIMILKISLMMYTSVLSRINILVSKQLISLSITGYSFKRHSRTLISAFIMLVMCVSYFVQVTKSNIFETWLFPVTVFMIEIFLSLFVSIIIYLLNLIHFYYYTVWYELYDYIYYLESLKNAITVFLSVLLLVTGINKLFESGSILRLLFILIHFYYNVWMQLVSGWRAWEERCLISHCISTLQIATKKEIEEVGGICVICLNDFNKHVTSITRCNHFFHFYCLKKWLCERKTCPICHRTILSTNSSYISGGRRHLHAFQS